MSSSGNPYVAASVNASSPEIDLPPCQLVEQAHAALERLTESFLLGANDALDLGSWLAASSGYASLICPTTTAGSG